MRYCFLSTSEHPKPKGWFILSAACVVTVVCGAILPAVAQQQAPETTSSPATTAQFLARGTCKVKNTPVVGKTCAPVYITPKKPAIPDSLTNRKFDTSVRIHVVFGANGQLRATLMKHAGAGLEALDDVALAACKHVKFKPAYEDGNPVDDTHDFNFLFKNSGQRRRLMPRQDRGHTQKTNSWKRVQAPSHLPMASGVVLHPSTPQQAAERQDRINAEFNRISRARVQYEAEHGEELGREPVPVSVHPAHYLTPQKPAIPDSLIGRKLDTSVHVRVVFGWDGQIRTTVVKRAGAGLEALDDAALATCESLKFTPASEDGSLIDDTHEFAFQFRQ